MEPNDVYVEILSYLDSVVADAFGRYPQSGSGPYPKGPEIKKSLTDIFDEFLASELEIKMSLIAQDIDTANQQRMTFAEAIKSLNRQTRRKMESLKMEKSQFKIRLEELREQSQLIDDVTKPEQDRIIRDLRRAEQNLLHFQKIGGKLSSTVFALKSDFESIHEIIDQAKRNQKATRLNYTCQRRFIKEMTLRELEIERQESVKDFRSSIASQLKQLQQQRGDISRVTNRLILNLNGSDIQTIVDRRMQQLQTDLSHFMVLERKPLIPQIKDFLRTSKQQCEAEHQALLADYQEIIQSLQKELASSSTNEVKQPSRVADSLDLAAIRIFGSKSGLTEDSTFLV